MVDSRMERSGGYAGIAFIVLAILAALVPGLPPPPDAPVIQVGAYLAVRHTAWLFAGWLVLPQIAFFLWFLVQLRAHLQHTLHEDDGLPTFLLTGGVVAGTIALLLGLVQVVMVFDPVWQLGRPLVRVLFDIYNAGGAFIFLPTSVFLFAASQSGLRHGTLPNALVTWGYIAAFGAAISTLTVFATSGFFAMGGAATLIFGFIPLAIWTIWTSLVLMAPPRAVETTQAVSRPIA